MSAAGARQTKSLLLAILYKVRKSLPLRHPIVTLGGYSYTDVGVGLPLNVLCGAIAIVLVPRVWSF